MRKAHKPRKRTRRKEYSNSPAVRSAHTCIDGGSTLESQQRFTEGHAGKTYNPDAPKCVHRPDATLPLSSTEPPIQLMTDSSTLAPTTA